MASGLGSVNIANLVSNWSSGKFAASTTTLMPASTPVSITHGQSVTVNFTVAPTVPTGTPTPPTPTGDLSLIAETGRKPGRNRAAVFPIGQRYW